MKDINTYAKVFNKIMSVLLITVMLLILMPSISFANETIQSKNITVLSEDVSLRSKFSKHFLMSDGSYMAITYPEAVHEKIDGAWQEIDNTLSNTIDRYASANSSFPVSFTSANNEQMVSITSKGNQLAWSLKAIADDMIISGSKNSNIAISDRSSLGFEMAERAVSAIQYSQIFGRIQDISVNYTVTHNKLEEDIIINERGSVDSFRMVMDAGKLVPRVNKDNSITFFDGDSEVFNISPPYMCDAADNILNDFTVELTQQDKELWIDYIPAHGWLNSEERVYPILFDPAITTTEYQSGIIDTYVAEGDTAAHDNEQKIYAGIKNGKIHRSYIKITALPTIPDSMPITNIELVLRNTNGSTTGRTFGVYKVTSAWDPSSITYANQPSIGARIATDEFNANNLVNTFSLTSEINAFYPEHFAGTNYGYMVRYTDESKTNADYNAFYSTEHSTKSSRPYIKIYYSYFKPTCLVNNAVYTLQNARSLKYLSVYGGTDANGTNVCQLTKDNTAKQQFRLQTTDGGAYLLRANCSSNGTNRVLDIVKNNGYVVDGCNAQIYTNVDAIAQEWLIIPVGSGFKISPRTNMSLALTAYGTANGTSTGTTSTSEGNVYLTEYTGNPEQHWLIYDIDGNQVSSVEQEFDNDDYYFNNIGSGKFLMRNVTNAYASSGTVNYLGSLAKWNIICTQGDNYVIRNIDDATKYLAVESGNYNTNVVIQTATGTVPNSCLWKIYYANGGVVICNVANGWYLCENASDIITMPYSSASNMNMYWRCVSVSDYGSSSSNSMRELTSSYTIDTLSLDVGQTKQPVINKTPIGVNVVWAAPNDFIYTASSSGIVNINNDTGSIIGLTPGIVTITATHKVTNFETEFIVGVISPDLPDLFYDLILSGDINVTDIQCTSDGFFMCTKSIANIMNGRGIYHTLTFAERENGIDAGGVQRYYDDWYIYCVVNNSTEKYSILKMREEETVNNNGTSTKICPSMAISFVELDSQIFLSMLELPSTNNRESFENELRGLINVQKMQYDTQLRTYFNNPASSASYLIAEYYVQWIANMAVDGVLSVPENTMLNAEDRIWIALTDNNTPDKMIFVGDKLYFNDVHNLDYNEKLAILLTHTGHASFNSLAAEVKAHAWALTITDNIFLNHYYASCLKVDMAIDETQDELFLYLETEFAYYNLESAIVQEQAQYHGEY